jgi:tRNA pseudouridine32 synthase/23S rRNA pseudouridine746 synthase
MEPDACVVSVAKTARGSQVRGAFDPSWLIHCSEDLLVLNKPSGLLCQPGRGPALSDSLITRLQQHWPEAKLVHRLDRDTSGLLLVALAAPLHRELSVLFAERRVLKRYLADVHGVPQLRQGVIAAPIAKRQNDPPLYGLDPAGKASETHWHLLESNGGNSRLQLEPRTGRSHQLRVHLQSIGHPILGDPLYAPAGGNTAIKGVARLHLHAAELAFVHPCSGAPMHFCSVAPFCLQAC